MRCLAALLVALLIIAPARADVPRIDPAKVCDAIARLHGPFEQDVYDRCLVKEQAAYDTLKALWPVISSEVKRRCTGRDGSYDQLAACLKEQAAAALGHFRF
jgi:hypothetical protein